ncbi:MAG: nucleotidyl transferase AbiEii/AbiGii toxin family protein [Pseudomonadales bacterium]|jgi:hypothetical protein|nr:nucleotidyl transferase AbiEii/AbiGii toxin family protein [Pseudomonadales bacterium]MDP7143962.1 nucleotidyl transferase AbiEii/AbiGii toxin family protein [Pseudomonadales bacterium]MDP7357305.1 nucleotidyl transferase AbiEii/AbiGii toxin family protein [Pseudomonadales bacterium]MDP7596642.1 nucleotidyl transferase AbiEii/AbiGii toxin family protein [Pseudomonadales bacterium]HJN52180.1 nucleotidyl transferase AbiEii/AbiGii toxin family protein [Pseudomonadales bacterium]|tara:strand:- start:909 stop:1595 length:687 start_codon:yes stop_codon:yes gene_type:complete
MPEFTRPRHRTVLRALENLNASFLESSGCYFGGGTRIVLELGEYRESMDIDFMCADRDGYRKLRGTISDSSLGEIGGALPLWREVRADMYGIRTFVDVAGQPVKFEIISEGRISIDCMTIDGVPVASLSHASCLAEKLLANSDRGNDTSTRSRDLIDLAFMIASWPKRSVSEGMELAESAYGHVIKRDLENALQLFADKSHRQRCISELAVSNSRKLNRGLKHLRELV